MLCTIDDLRDKEVITVNDGVKLGYVYDAQFDTQNAYLTSIIVYGRPKFFGLLGRDDDHIISWKDITLIGDDTILVSYEPNMKKKRKSGLLSNFFETK